jgi:hypothetical protein
MLYYKSTPAIPLIICLIVESLFRLVGITQELSGGGADGRHAVRPDDVVDVVAHPQATRFRQFPSL